MAMVVLLQHQQEILKISGAAIKESWPSQAKVQREEYNNLLALFMHAMFLYNVHHTYFFQLLPADDSRFDLASKNLSNLTTRHTRLSLNRLRIMRQWSLVW
jgi:hypothetical protein